MPRSIFFGFALSFAMSAVAASVPIQSGALPSAVSDEAIADELDVFLLLETPAYLPRLNQVRLANVESAPGLMADRLASTLEQSQQDIRRAQENVLYAARRAGVALEVRRRFSALLNALVVRVRREDIEALRRLDGVRDVKADSPVHATLDDSVPLIGAPPIWTGTDASGQSLTGHGITVAIIDSGIDYTHPDLGGCFGETCKVVGGWDFVNNDADPMDDNRHGTHVAGIVAANGVKLGVAPDAKLIAYKVLGAQGGGFVSHIVAAMEAATDPDGDPLTDDHVDVMNLSLSSVGGPDDPASLALDQATQLGVLGVVSAGNGGPKYSSYLSPAAAETAVTVANTTKQDGVAQNSSRGPVRADDYAVVKPEIAAPGSSIVSSVPDGLYSSLSGTSMAAPHVAGAAALMRQRYPTHSPGQIKSLLVNSATLLAADIYSAGSGRLDLPSALNNGAITVEPAITHFGWVDNTVAAWDSPVRKVTFTNHDSTQRTIRFSIDRGNTPAGADWNAMPDITLQAGEARVVDMQMNVRNDVVPISPHPTGVFESALRIESDDVELRMPMVIHKSAMLTVAIVNNGAPGRATFFNNAGQELTSFEFEVGSQERQLRMPSGIAHALVSVPTHGVVLLSENIDVSQATQRLEIDIETATRPIPMPAYQRLDGSPLQPAHIGLIKRYVSVTHVPSGKVFPVEAVGGYFAPLFRFGDISPNFNISAMTLTGERAAGAGSEPVFYYSSWSSQGVDENTDLSMPPSDTPLRVTYAGPDLAQGSRWQVNATSLDGKANGMFGLMTAGSASVAPIRILFHLPGGVPAAHTIMPSLCFGNSACSHTVSLFRGTATADGSVRIFEPRRDADGVAHPADLVDVSPDSGSPAEIVVGQLAAFWAGQFNFIPRDAQGTTGVFSLPDQRNPSGSGFFRDGLQNKEALRPFSYQWFIDGEEAGAGYLPVASRLPQTMESVVPATTQSKVELFMRQQFSLRGIEGVSRVHLKTRAGYLRSPHLKSLQVLDPAGKSTSVVNPDTATAHSVALVVGDDESAVSVGLELDIGNGWQALPLVAGEPGHYRAYLPPLAGFERGNLRVSLHDTDTPDARNETVNILSPAFLAPQGALRIYGAPVRFGTTAAGSVSNPGVVTLANESAGPVTVDGLTAVQAPFVRTGGSCPAASFTLAPGTRCSTTFFFEPATTGRFEQRLSVSVDGTTSIPFDLSGEAGIHASLDITSAHLDFGPHMTGVRSDPLRVGIANVGPGAAEITAIDAVSSPFDYAAGSCGSPPFMLAPGRQCSLSVTFEPSAEGPFQSAFTISTSSAGSGTVTLSGVGLTQRGIRVAPTSLAFGDRLLTAGPGTPLSVTITNDGPAQLALSGIALVGPQPAQFMIVADSGEATLAPGAARTLQLAFDPDQAGALSARLRVMSDDASTPSVDVEISGTGVTAVPQIELSRMSLTYGERDIDAGASEVQTVEVRNAGAAPLELTEVSIVGAHAGDFAIAGDSGSAMLPPGAVSTLALRFDPSTTGVKMATLRIVSNDAGSPDEVALDGVGIESALAIFRSGFEQP